VESWNCSILVRGGEAAQLGHRLAVTHWPGMRPVQGTVWRGGCHVSLVMVDGGSTRCPVSCCILGLVGSGQGYMRCSERRNRSAQVLWGVDAECPVEVSAGRADFRWSSPSRPRLTDLDHWCLPILWVLFHVVVVGPVEGFGDGFSRGGFGGRVRLRPCWVSSRVFLPVGA
jgi:hypothetical protein